MFADAFSASHGRPGPYTHRDAVGTYEAAHRALRVAPLLALALAFMGCAESHGLPAYQPADAGPAWSSDAAPELAEEPGCLEWVASPGSEYHEGSPEDVRCVRWAE